MPASIELSVCGLDVSLSVEDPALEGALELAWTPALSSPWEGPVRKPRDAPPSGSQERLDYALCGGQLCFQGAELARGLARWDLLARFERHLLDELTRRCSDSILLHAGAVVGPAGLFVFLGPSGVGKSTMTREAVRRGYGYLTDDLLVVGEEEVCGVGRSIQFDPLPEGRAPGFLRDCAVDGYFIQTETGLSSVPLYRHRSPAILALPAAQWPVHVCRLRRGAQLAVRRLSSLELVKQIHQASLLSGRSYDGRWDRAVGWEICLGEPGPTFEQLEDAVARL